MCFRRGLPPFKPLDVELPEELFPEPGSHCKRSFDLQREEESQNTSFVSGHSSLLPGGYEKENEYDYKKIFDKSLRNNSVTEKSPDDSFRYPSKIMHNDDSFNETENIIRKLEGKMFTNEDFCSDQDNEVLYNSYQSDHKTFTTKDKEDFLKIMDSENNNKKSVIFVSPSFIASSSNQGKHSDVKFFNPEKSGSPQETKSALNSSDNLNKESTSSGQTPKQKVKDFISSLANNYFSNPTVHNSERVDKPVAHLEISSSNRNKLSNKNEQKSDPMLSPNPTPKSVVNKEKIYDKMENHRVGKRNKINNNVIETNNKKEESKFYIVENGSRKWVVGQQCTSQQDWGYSRDGFEEEGLHEIGQNQNQSNLSDSIQEKEVRISFKMDPESRQSPIETPIHELTKENQRKRGLPGVKPLHINPETVKIIEISNKKVRETFNSKKQITSLAAIRKESIGKKLKDALTNLKSGSNGEQAFKKKAEFNVITASSKNTSRNVSPATQILSKVKSRFSGQNNKAGNSIATTLNAIMNRSRKSSVGSKESSRSKFNSGALIKSIIKPMEKALNSSSCQSEKNSVESKKRTKLTFSGSKKPAGSNQIGGIPMIHFDEREVMKSSRTDQGKFPKSNSNSTSRLFNKIFSRDQESAGKSMEEGRFKSLNRESVQTRTRPNLSEFERNLNNSDKKEKAKGVGLDSLIQKMYQAGSSKALSEHYLTTERSVTSTEKQLNPKAHEVNFDTFKVQKKEQSKTESLLESRKPSNHSARNNDASTLREKLKKTLLSGEKKGAKSRIHTSKTNPEGERTLNSSKYDQSESDLHENQSSKTSLLTERFLRMDFMKKNLLLENEKPSQKAAYKDEMRNTNLHKQIFQNNLLKSKSQIKSTRVSPLPKTEKYQESKLQYSTNTNYLPQANKKQKSPLREKKELKLEFDFPSLKPAELAQQRYQKNQTNYTSSISFGLARKQSSGFSQRK